MSRLDSAQISRFARPDVIKSPYANVYDLRFHNSYTNKYINGSCIANYFSPVVSHTSVFAEHNSGPRSLTVRKINCDSVQIRLRISSGNFGSVYAGTYGRAMVAIKMLHTRNDSIIREAAVQSYVQSPFIVDVYGVCLDSPKALLVMEYCELGSLSSYLSTINSNNITLPIHEGMQFSLDIVSGLSYIHGMGVVHRDIRADNILLKIYEDTLHAKICDFGISKSFRDNHASTSGIRFNLAPTILGPSEYLPPEMKLPNRLYYGSNNSVINLHTPASDMYMYGKLLSDIYQAITQPGLYSIAIGLIDHIKTVCCSVDPVERYTAETVILFLKSRGSAWLGRPYMQRQVADRSTDKYETNDYGREIMRSAPLLYASIDHVNLTTSSSAFKQAEKVGCGSNVQYSTVCPVRTAALASIIFSAETDVAALPSHLPRSKVQDKTIIQRAARCLGIFSSCIGRSRNAPLPCWSKVGMSGLEGKGFRQNFVS